MLLLISVLLFGVAASAFADGGEDDDLIEVTVGTVTKMMTHEELLKSGLVPQPISTPAQADMERLIRSGAFTQVSKPYPHGAIRLEDKDRYDWPGGQTHTRDQLKARLDQAVRDLASADSGRRESAATFVSAVWQYAKVRYAPTIAPLRKALADRDLSVRREAAFALAYLGEMKSARPELIAQCYFSRLAALGDSKVLEEIIRRKQFPFTCRAQALHYLSQYEKGKRAKDIELRLIEDGLSLAQSDYEREYYVGALGNANGPLAIQKLRALAVSDPSASVRKAAQDTLKRIGASGGGTP